MNIGSINSTDNNPNFGMKLWVTRSARRAFEHDKPLLKDISLDTFERTLSDRVSNIEPKNEALIFDAMGGYTPREHMFKLILRGEENTYGYNERASINQNVDWLVGGSLVDLRKMAHCY